MKDGYRILLSENIMDESVEVLEIDNIHEDEISQLIRILVPKGIDVLIQSKA